MTDTKYSAISLLNKCILSQSESVSLQVKQTMLEYFLDEHFSCLPVLLRWSQAAVFVAGPSALPLLLRR